MAHEFLNRSDIVTVFEQVSGEAVPERVTGSSLSQSCKGVKSLLDSWQGIVITHYPVFLVFNSLLFVSSYLSISLLMALRTIKSQAKT
jgi:hypothetical protein